MWSSVFRGNPLQTVDFHLRDYLSPGGRYPYENLAKDMEAAFKAGRDVYLYSVPGFLMVSGYHGGNPKKPWCVDPATGGRRLRCYHTATEAIRGGHAALSENPDFSFDLRRAHQPEKFSPGDKVYADLMGGLVPAVVVHDKPDAKTVVLRYTATRGPWKKGEVQEHRHSSVVHRDQVYTRGGQYRIGPRRR